jgi:hypothetical protein
LKHRSDCNGGVMAVGSVNAWREELRFS